MSRGQPIWKSTVRDYATLPPSQTVAFGGNPNALAPQLQQQQQQPLMAMVPPQQLYQQPYQNGSGYNQQQLQPQPQPQAQYPPPQPVPSPGAMSQASYGTQPQQPLQQPYGQPAYPQV